VTAVKTDAKKLTYTSPSEDGSAEIHQGGSNAPAKPVDNKNDDKPGQGSAFFKN
jgi:hypothetical protein